MLRRGDILEDRYRIDDLIGEGGMSKVWKARDLYINTDWAIKEIDKHKKEYLDIQDENGNIPEFEFLKTLNHPAFPRIVHTIDEPGTMYIIMDYIEGENLLKILDLYGRPSEEDIAAWIIEACDAIDYLHEHNIIHRDIKPSNMMIDKQGNLKIIDMGSACYKGNIEKPLGTYGYASPEHHKGEVDERSDVYTVGMTLYHLLTGIDPTPKRFKYIPLREVDENISSGLSKIVDKAVSKNPDDRYKSVRVMADALYSYKKLDDEYISGLKKKIGRMIALYSVGLLMLFLSIGLIGSGIKAEKRTYEYLVYSETSDLEARVKELETASSLRPKEPAPYIEMIKAYSADGLFTEGELMKVSSLYQSHKEQLAKDEEAFAEVNYEIGESILTFYTGETDSSNRAKLMAAMPYFENARHKKFDKEALASGYFFMGSFYRDYVIADTSLVLKSASREDYENLLNESKDITEKITAYTGDPQGKMKLITYDIVLSLIDSQRNGIAKSGIEKESLMEIVEAIKENTSKIEGEDRTIKEMKADVEKEVKDVSEKIEMSYEQEAKLGG